MAAYLSSDWLAAPVDPAAEAAAAQGIDVQIGRIVTKAPDGDARFTAQVSGGTVTYVEGVDDSVDITFTDTFKNAVALVRGELDPNALFMRGQTKVTGGTGLILDVLAATKSDAYETARTQLLAAVEA